MNAIFSSYASVLVEDRWPDGSRREQNLPEESAWFASNASSLTAATNGMTGTVPSTSSRTWWTYFTNTGGSPAAVNVGETLRVTLDFVPSGVASMNSNTSLRFGLFNSSGGNRTLSDGSNPAGAGINGYALIMNFGTTLQADPLRISERTNVSSSSLISGLPDFALLGAGGGPAGTPGFSSGEPYTLELSVTRNADSVAVSAVFSNTNGWSISHTAADIAGMTTSFDTFVIFSARAVESASTFQFTRFKVETAPAALLTNAPSHVETVVIADTTAAVSFSGEPGAPVEVQRSIDLVNWIPLATTNVPGSGSFTLTDTFPDLGSAPSQAYYRLRGLIPIAPTIDASPVNRAAAAGDTVILELAASGSEPLRYQWYFNSAPLAGATNATLLLANVQGTNAGTYVVFVSNGAGTALSEPATLSVFTAPAITMQPQSLVAFEGATAKFAVAAVGAAPLHHQWFFNGNPVANATNTLLTVSNVQPASAGNYFVVVSNIVGAATSSVASVTVNPSNSVPDFSLAGFGSVAGSITGGQGGATVTVSNASDFIFYVTQTARYIVRVQGTINFGSVSVRSGKTILGLGTNATLIGSLNFSSVSNIVVRNVFITNPTGTGTGDGVTIRNGAHHIWIDHCTFYDCSDGALDITLASDYVTVSWSKFYYTSNTGHNFVNLIGADDANTGDRGKLRVTFHHNWWSTLCIERMPRVRFGQVHAYNNYYDANGNNYCLRAAIESQLLIENNHFHRVKDPYVKYITTGAPGRISASGNLFVSTTGSRDPGTDTVFAPPYSYAINPAASVPNLVTNYAGAGVVGF